MAYMGRITEMEMIETFFTLIIAGTDTTTRLIANIILCLAMNPDIQEKLYAEIDNVLGDKINIDYDTVVKIKYLDRVIKESLRFLSHVPFIARRAGADIQLEHITIPAGTEIIPINGIHMNESIWGANVTFETEWFKF